MQINLINELTTTFGKSTTNLKDQIFEFKRDQVEYEPFRWACTGGHNVVVKYLLDECNLPVDIVDESGWTPLIIASSFGHEDIALDLLRRHANPNKQTDAGKTALHYAASNNHFHIVEMLLLYTDEINVAEGEMHSTPLHEAASKGNLHIVRLLLDKNCRLDMQDLEGNTPLHLACAEERREVAELLIRRGASITIKNNEENTALQLVPSYCVKRILGNLSK